MLEPMNDDDLRRLVAHVQINGIVQQIASKPELKPDVSEVCPNCSSEDLAKVKGCIRCLKCGFKQDCNGW